MQRTNRNWKRSVLALQTWVYIHSSFTHHVQKQTNKTNSRHFSSLSISTEYHCPSPQQSVEYLCLHTCVSACVCVSVSVLMRACMRACMGVGVGVCICSCLHLTTSSSCVNIRTSFFFLMTFIILMYMYVFNLYCSAF